MPLKKHRREFALRGRHIQARRLAGTATQISTFVEKCMLADRALCAAPIAS